MVEQETKADLGKELLKQPDSDPKAAGSEAPESWNISHGTKNHEQDVAEIKKEGKFSSAEAIEKEVKRREDAQFRKGLADLNEQLHEGGQLPKEINIVGFDTKGSLIAKDSDQQHIYVIAAETGKVVAKSELKDGKVHWDTGKGHMTAQEIDVPPEKAAEAAKPYDARGAISNLKRDGENISEIELINGMQIDGKRVDGKQAYTLRRPGDVDEALANLKVNEQDGSLTFQNSQGHSHKIDNQGNEHEWWQATEGMETYVHTREGGPLGPVRNFVQENDSGTYYIEVGPEKGVNRGFYWIEINTGGHDSLKMTQAEANIWGIPSTKKTNGEHVDW